MDVSVTVRDFRGPFGFSYCRLSVHKVTENEIISYDVSLHPRLSTDTKKQYADVHHVSSRANNVINQLIIFAVNRCLLTA